MARIVTPIDWGIVGRSFHVVIEADPADPELDLRVNGLDDSIARGLKARDIRKAGCQRTEDPGLRRCWVRDLPGDGRYVLLLTRAGDPLDMRAQSAVHVFGAHGWTRRNRRIYGERGAPAQRPAGSPPLFSVITTVYDTEARLFAEAAASVLTQRHRDFEWLILDNGSRERPTIEAIAQLPGVDRRVKAFRVEDNIHIVRGNRYLLERAQGDFILPIDADDLLYPEALALFAEAIGAHPRTTMVFGDEEKVDAFAEPIEAIGRPCWSRLATMCTVPSSHPTAFRRQVALALGVYTDEGTRGSHDWDTALRFADAGHDAIHVPAVLYGWRVHTASTSLTATAKSYVGSSQERVVRASLARRGMEHRYDIRGTEAGPGYFRLARRRVEPVPCSLAMFLRQVNGATVENLLETLQRTEYPLTALAIVARGGGVAPLPWGAVQETIACRGWPKPTVLEVGPGESLERLRTLEGFDGLHGHVAIVDGAIKATTPGWLWEAIGTLELDAEAGAAGGRIYDRRSRIQHLGLVTGLDGSISTPYFGMRHEDTRLRSISLHQRAVSAVHNGFIVARDSLVREVGLPSLADADFLACDMEWTRKVLATGATFAFAADMIGLRATPFRAKWKESFEIAPRARRYPRVDGTDPYYSPYFSLDGSAFGLPVPSREPGVLDNLWRLIGRRLRGRATPVEKTEAV